jgi:hypothetical protein
MHSVYSASFRNLNLRVGLCSWAEQGMINRNLLYFVAVHHWGNPGKSGICQKMLDAMSFTTKKRHSHYLMSGNGAVSMAICCSDWGDSTKKADKELCFSYGVFRRPSDSLDLHVTACIGSFHLVCLRWDKNPSASLFFTPDKVQSQICYHYQ